VPVRWDEGWCGIFLYDFITPVFKCWYEFFLKHGRVIPFLLIGRQKKMGTSQGSRPCCKRFCNSMLPVFSPSGVMLRKVIILWYFIPLLWNYVLKNDRSLQNWKMLLVTMPRFIKCLEMKSIARSHVKLNSYSLIWV